MELTIFRSMIFLLAMSLMALAGCFAGKPAAGYKKADNPECAKILDAAGSILDASRMPSYSRDGELCECGQPVFCGGDKHCAYAECPSYKTFYSFLDENSTIDNVYLECLDLLNVPREKAGIAEDGHCRETIFCEKTLCCAALRCSNDRAFKPEFLDSAFFRGRMANEQDDPRCDIMAEVQEFAKSEGFGDEVTLCEKLGDKCVCVETIMCGGKPTCYAIEHIFE